MADEKALSLEAQVRLNLQRAEQQWNAFQRKSGTFRPTLDASRFGVGKLADDVSKLDKSLISATNRVTTLGAAFAVFFAIQRGFVNFVASTIEVEAALARINVNLDQTGKGLEEFSRGLFETARQTGATFAAAARSAEEFARQGLTVAETQKRTRDALVLARIAAIDAGEATTDLTAAVNTFKAEALTTTDIVNRLAAVDTRFAVSSRDLGLAISRVGNSAQEAGVSFNELLGIVTAVQQSTQRGGSVIGNSLKTIFTRIARPEVLDQLQALGVATKDLNNNNLPAIQILKNLSNQYDALSTAQKSVLAEQVGGVYQINILKAAVADLSKETSVYSQVLGVAANAQNEAFEKNAQLNKTLQASIAGTANSIKELFSNVGNVRAGGFFKAMLGAVEEARKALGDDGNESESIGETFGNGIVKGISNVLTGPVFIGVGYAIAKGLGTILETFQKSLRAEIGLKSVSEQREAVLRRITEVIGQANAAEARQLGNATTLLAQKEAILRIVQRIAAEEARATVNNAALATSFLQPGIRGNIDPRLGVRKAAEGYIPYAQGARAAKQAADGYLPAIVQEQQSISKGVGGASPAAKPVVIPNFVFSPGRTGALVANSDEHIVPNYNGSGASAIFNPKMVREMGLPKGAQKISAAAGGVVPQAAGGFFSDIAKRFTLPKYLTAIDPSYAKRFQEIVKQDPKLASFLRKAIDQKNPQAVREMQEFLGGKHVQSTPSRYGLDTTTYFDLDEDPKAIRGKVDEVFGRFKKKSPLSGAAGGYVPPVIDTGEGMVRKAADGVVPNFANPQTQSKAFKAFFGDSKVRTADGKPQVVYHGTGGDDFSSFDPSKISRAYQGFGFHFTPSKTLATKYAEQHTSGQRVMPSYLSVKNPAPAEVYKQVSNEVYNEGAIFGVKAEREIVNRLKKRGYDGTVYRHEKWQGTENEDTTSYVPFDSTQIKSAIGNRGTFDPRNRDITAANGLIPNFAGPLGLRRGATQVGEGVFGRALKSPDPINVDGTKTSVLFKDFKPDGEKEQLIRREYAISKLAREMGLPVARVYGSAKRSADRGGLYKEFIDGTRGDKLRPEIREPVESALRNQFRDKGITPFDLRGPNYVVRKGANLDDIEDVIRNAVVVDPGGFESLNIGATRQQYNKHYYSKAGGHIPNLAAALTREVEAGVDPKSIYVDRDPRVKSAGNPQGLLVANRRDEPQGGFQGVERVLARGGNPRIAGAAGGIIPNFAAEQTPGQKQDIYQNFLQGKIVQPADVQGEVSEAVQARRKKLEAERARDIDRAYAQIAKEEQLAKAKRQLTEAEIRRSEQALGATQKLYGKARERGEGLGIERPKSVLPPTYYANQAIANLGSPIPLGPPPLTTAQKNQLATDNIKTRLVTGDSRKASPDARAEFEARRAALSGVPSGLASDFGSSQKLQVDRDKFQSQRIEERRKFAFERAVGRRLGGSEITPAQQRLVTQELAEQGRASARGKFAPGARPEAIRGYVRNYVKEQLATLNLGFDEKALPPDITPKNPPRPSIGSRLNRVLRSPAASIGLAIGAPLVAGQVEALSTRLPGRGVGGTAGGVATGVASLGLQGAGIGAIFGPIGAGVGAAAGALIGAFTKLKKSTSELADELGEKSMVERKQLDSVGAYIQIQEAYTQAIASGNLEVARKISTDREQFLKNLSSESPGALKAINSVKEDPKGQIELSNRLQSDFAKAEAARKATASLSEVDGGFIRSGATKKETDQAAKDLAAVAAQLQFNLADADTDFASGTKGGGSSTAAQEKLQKLFSDMGQTVTVTSANFFDLAKVMAEAKKIATEFGSDLATTNKRLKDLEVSLFNAAAAARKAALSDVQKQTALQGSVQRQQDATGFNLAKREGISTVNQNLDLRGAADRERVQGDAAVQASSVQREVDKALRALIQGAATGKSGDNSPAAIATQQKREEALKGNLGTSELFDFAKELGVNFQSLKAEQEKYQLALAEIDIATKESIKTIDARTAAEKAATEVIRRQTAFSNYTPEQGRQLNASMIGQGETRGVSPAFLAKQDEAFLAFFDALKSFGADISALKPREVETRAKVQERNVLDLTRGQLMTSRAPELALAGLRSSTYSKRIGGEPDMAQLQRGADALAKSKNEKTAAEGREIQDRLSGARANREAASPEGRIENALNDFFKNDSDDSVAKLNLEAANALKAATEAFNSKQSQFAVDLKSQVEVVIPGLEALVSAGSATAIQDQIALSIKQALGPILTKIAKLEGKPIPAAAK